MNTKKSGCHSFLWQYNGDRRVTIQIPPIWFLDKSLPRRWRSKSPSPGTPLRGYTQQGGAAELSGRTSHLRRLEGGSDCALEAVKDGSLSKATKSNHCLSLHQEPFQKKSSPKGLHLVSQQTPLQDLSTAWWCPQ